MRCVHFCEEFQVFSTGTNVTCRILYLLFCYALNNRLGVLKHTADLFPKTYNKMGVHHLQ